MSATSQSLYLKKLEEMCQESYNRVCEHNGQYVNPNRDVVSEHSKQQFLTSKSDLTSFLIELGAWPMDSVPIHPPHSNDQPDSMEKLKDDLWELLDVNSCGKVDILTLIVFVLALMGALKNVDRRSLNAVGST